MIIEALIIVALIVSGASLLRAYGLNGFALLPLGFMSGIGLFMIFSYIQAFFGAQATILFPLGVSVLAPIILLLVKYRQQKVKIGFSPVFLGGLLCIIVLSIAIGEANLFKFHFDSLRYLTTASILATGELDSLHLYRFEWRFTSIAMLHSLSNFTDEFYLRSIHPLISGALLSSMGWIVYEGFKKTVSHQRLLILIFSSILFLATAHTYVWHTFYINGHLLMGAFAMLAAGLPWLIAQKGNDVPVKAHVIAWSLAVVGLIFTRPEGAFMAIIILAPSLMSDKIRFRYRSFVLGVFSTAVVVQQSFIIYTILNIDGGRDMPLAAMGLLGLGLLGFIAIPLLGSRKLTRENMLPNIAEFGLWLLLALFIFNSPDIFINSLTATIENVILSDGNWGLSFTTLTIIFVLSLLIWKFPYQVFVRFPITAFVPSAFLIAYLRGGAYRVGAGDSFNRMLMHIVPMMLLFVILSAAKGELNPGLSSLLYKLKRPFVRL